MRRWQRSMSWSETTCALRSWQACVCTCQPDGTSQFLVPFNPNMKPAGPTGKSCPKDSPARWDPGFLPGTLLSQTGAAQRTFKSRKHPNIRCPQRCYFFGSEQQWHHSYGCGQYGHHQHPAVLLSHLWCHAWAHSLSTQRRHSPHPGHENQNRQGAVSVSVSVSRFSVTLVPVVSSNLF